MQGQNNPTGRLSLEPQGIRNVANIYWNLTTAALIEHALRRHEGLLASGGALVVRTGSHTGRSPNDKFVVKEPSSESKIWWGPVNRPFEPDRFDRLYQRVLSYLQGKNVFVQDCFVGADARYQLPIRVVTENAWHSLFARQLFIRPDWTKAVEHAPQFTLIDVPGFQAIPDVDGTRSESFIILHLAKKVILVGGTSYAGEIKKAMFTVMNFILPQQKVMSMHASANVGKDGDAALFFGLSGTGKTSLSADPERQLVGDDEIGWSGEGLFNFEGGCYAKCIRLSQKDEPLIYGAVRFGTVLENVAVDSAGRVLNFDDDSLTENTRACYPLTFVENALLPSRSGHPQNVIFLTCDAFAVLPPISKLTPDQAMYHFISGYSAKVAGTEAGIKEPQATFSACFGAPFMALHPAVYAKLLKEKMSEHHVNCWLINTGWSGGPYGIGQRINIGYTRAMVRAALSGTLANVETRLDPVFKLAVPAVCPGVPSDLLWPRNTWRDPIAYDRKAQELLARFDKNFEQFKDAAPELRSETATTK